GPPGADGPGRPGARPAGRGPAGPARERAPGPARGGRVLEDVVGRPRGLARERWRCPPRSPRRRRVSRPPVRIAWVSPLPPIPSGIGDYSFELLPMVAARAPVEVVSPTPRGRRLHVPDGVTVRRPSALPALARRGDVLVHHLGNNPHHEYVYRA